MATARQKSLSTRQRAHANRVLAALMSSIKTELAEQDQWLVSIPHTGNASAALFNVRIGGILDITADRIAEFASRVGIQWARRYIMGGYMLSAGFSVSVTSGCVLCNGDLSIAFSVGAQEDLLSAIDAVVLDPTTTRRQRLAAITRLLLRGEKQGAASTWPESGPRATTRPLHCIEIDACPGWTTQLVQALKSFDYWSESFDHTKLVLDIRDGFITVEMFSTKQQHAINILPWHASALHAEMLGTPLHVAST